MKSPSFRALRGHLLREAITLLLFAGMLLQSATAAAPGWWAAQGVLKPGATPDDYAALNQGQLKNFVRAAIYELHAKLLGGAGALLGTLLDTWRTQKLNSDDYAAVTVGQLKAVAKPVYASMQAAGLAQPVPWTELATDDDDYAAANIGQAKAVFAFVVPNLVLMGTVKKHARHEQLRDAMRHFVAQVRHKLLVFNAFVRPPCFRCWRVVVGRCSAAPSARVSLSVSGRAASLFLPHPPVRFRLHLKNPRRSQPANAEMGC